MNKSIFTKGIYVFLSLLLALGAFTAMPSGAVSADINQVYPAVVAGADRLVDLQNDDGGWDWPLDDGVSTNTSPLNTVGPIAKGLAEAYNRTGSQAHKDALELAGTLLLSKTAFSTSDGYLAAQLDATFGVTTYTDYVKTNFYDKLAAGTYNRNGTLYNTATYILAIRNSRAGTQASLAAWDVGMGLVGAASCGADTTEWIAGTKAEIDEIDGDNSYFDVIGLAGALYGLAFVGEDFDPTTGDFASDASLADLAESLAGYQLNTGGFTWNKNYLIEDDANEDIQTTAYAILALNEVDRVLYLSNIQNAADYMLNVQMNTGGWPEGGENNEVTAEAIWGISAAYPVLPEVWVCESGDCGHPEASFNVLQDGVNNVALGGIVHVLAATYTENVTIGKSVTILGEGVDHSSIVSGLMTIDANDVVLDGLTITNPDQPNAIVIKATSSNIDFTNNIFDSIGNTVLTSNVQAIYLQHGSDDVLIEGNIFRNIHSGTKSVKPVFVGDSNTLDPSEGLVVRNNSFENISSTGGGAYGILINNGTGTTGLLIEGNQFSNLIGKWTHAVGLEGPTPAAVVRDNVFSNLTSLVYEAAGVFFEANPVGGTVTVNYNQFNGSGYYGIAIHPNDIPLGYSVNGILNWWGTASGPNPIAGVGPNVDYSPWLGFVPGTSPMTFHTNDSIQDAIDVASAGDTVNVYPGNYDEFAYDRRLFNGSGPYQFGLFVSVEKADLTIQGVTADGAPITSYADVLAQVQLNPNNSFGFSGMFVEANGVTVSGLGISPHLDKLNKTIEVIGDAFTLQNNHVNAIDSSGVYINDWRYDTDTDVSYVQSYTIDGNWIENGSIDVNNGAGYSGAVSGRLITNNKITNNGEYAAVSFTGSDTGVPWFVESVGGAVITGNEFVGNDQHIRARGIYDNGQFDWASYWNENTFDKAVIVGVNPPNDVRTFTYTTSYGTMPDVRRIGGVIQGEIDHALPGDTVLVKNGTYVENVIVDEYISLIGAGSGNDPSIDTIIRKSSNSAVVTVSASGLSEVEPLLLQDLRIEPVGVYGLNLGNLAYLKLDNVKVIGSADTDFNENESCLKVATTADVKYLDVVNSAFDGCDYGWYIAKAVTVGEASTLQYVNVFNTTFNNNDYKGAYIEKLSDAVFENVSVLDNGSTGFWNNDWNAGIDVNLKNGDYQNLTFNNIIVDGNGLGYKEGTGLLVKARDDGSYAAVPATLDNVLITNSTFTGNERGIRLGEPGKLNAGPTNVVINFNRIFGNEQTYTGTDGSAYGGLVNQSVAAVSAENNWFGCNAGPDTTGCDAVAVSTGAGAVDSDPWIVLSLTADPTVLEPGMSADLEANLVMNSAGVSTAADGYIPQGLLVSFTAPDGGTVNPTSGLTVNSAVSSVFTAPDMHGDYQVCAAVDNELLCPIVPVVGPGAVDDAYSTPEDTTLVVAAPGVLTNDTGIETLPYAVALLIEPQHGQLTLNADGSFTYVPDAGFVGDDTFEYQVVTHPNDAKTGWSDEAIVTITVTPVNKVPVAVADAYDAVQNITLEIDAAEGVLANDTDADVDDSLEAVLVTDVSNGTLTLNADGSFTYVPNVNYVGFDSFTYYATDGEANSAPVTVTITVAPGIPVTGDPILIYLPFIVR